MINAQEYEAQIARRRIPTIQPLGPDSMDKPVDPAQMLIGQPVPEGTIVSQVVGRGEAMPQFQQMHLEAARQRYAPSMMVVPPAQPGAQPAPQMQMVPPSQAGRTTIGTFVETPRQPASLYDPRFGGTNPMVNTQAVPPAGTATAPVEVKEVATPAPKKDRKPLDLAQLILDHIHELGGEKSEEAQKFYDRSPSALKTYVEQPGKIPLECINRFLNRRLGVKEMILDELEPHFAVDGNLTESLPNRGKTNVMVCLAILERPTMPLFWTSVYLAKKYELGFEVMSDTVIHRSRNRLAQRFLASKCEWSLWLDGDIAAPIANPDWFRWITKTETISDDHTRHDVYEKLRSTNKAVVGGVYASRQYHGPLVIQPEIAPRSHEDKLLCNDLRKGLCRGVVDVNWIGFGCALVHRDVFLEVQRRFPDLAPQNEFAPWRFFNPVYDEGEDESFCTRVRQCAIPIFLDTDLICGHVGSMCFLPEHSQSSLAM